MNTMNNDGSIPKKNDNNNEKNDNNNNDNNNGPIVRMAYILAEEHLRYMEDGVRYEALFNSASSVCDNSGDGGIVSNNNNKDQFGEFLFGWFS